MIHKKKGKGSVMMWCFLKRALKAANRFTCSCYHGLATGCDEGQRFLTIKRFHIAPRVARGLIATANDNQQVSQAQPAFNCSLSKPEMIQPNTPSRMLMETGAVHGREQEIASHVARRGLLSSPRVWHPAETLNFFFLSGIHSCQWL